MKQTAQPYQSTVPACVHPSAQLLTLVGCCSPQEKGSSCRGRRMSHGQHTVCASQTCPRKDTHNFLQIWDPPQCCCFILHLQLVSLVSQTVVAMLLVGLVPYHVSTEAPQGCTLVPPCSPWQGCMRHWGCKYCPANTEKKEEWTPSYICLLSARDSHHCHIQGTLCSRVG